MTNLKLQIWCRYIVKLILFDSEFWKFWLCKSFRCHHFTDDINNGHGGSHGGTGGRSKLANFPGNVPYGDVFWPREHGMSNSKSKAGGIIYLGLIFVVVF